MGEFDDNRDERLQHEAEELMRQKRFLDAAHRYQDLRSQQPTDLWASLGHCSALECAGNIPEAQQILEEMTVRHKRSAPLHRFRRLFFERREDLPNAQVSTAALENDLIDEGPDDQLADLYFNQGRYLEARDELNRLLRSDYIDSDEMHASALARLGACLRQIGEFDEARRRLRESLRLEEDHHWALSELAEVERAQGDLDTARGHYLAALKSAPEDHWCRGHLAQLEVEAGNRDRAESLYREILQAEPQTPWALVELAQLVAERDGDESRQLAERALAADRNYPWAHAHLGQLARRNGDLKQAIQHHQDALNGAPDAPWLLHELAECNRLLGRFDEAHRLLGRARDHDPYEPSTYGYLADVLRAENRIPETFAHLTKAVELDPEYTWAWRELAELRALNNEHDAADEAYRHAVELEGDEAVNDGLRAFLLRCRGRRSAAQPWLERAVEKQPDYLWAWRELADLHLMQGDAEAAEATAKLALDHLPDNPPLQGLRSEALRRLGRHAEALPIVERALERADEVPQLHALKAEILAETGRLDAAQPCAERACALDDSPEYRALLAQILISADRLDQAETIVRDLVAGEKVAGEKPISSAFELAAILAEREEEPDAALAWCDRGLAVHADDPRLVTRRAKLAVQLGRPQPVQALIALMDSGVQLPWRDVAQIMAQAGESALAHRAAYTVLANTVDEDADRQAKAWLLLAEVDLALGRADDATAAASKALALDEDCVPARILAAVLAERRGQLPVAIAHLEHLDVRLHAGDNDEAGESRLLLRQLAGLYERAERIPDARACWQRIRDDAGVDDPDSAVEAAAFALRVQLDDAEAQAEELTQRLHGGARQRLLRERAIAATRRHGAFAGLELLDPEEAQLGADGHMLMAQLALAAGDPARALALCDALGAGTSAGTVVDAATLRLLRVRILLALRRLDEALALARVCQQNGCGDEATTLVAEALALLGRIEEACTVAQITGPAASGERGLLVALLHLERDGVVPFISALGRLAAPPPQHPLGRVFAAAWPGAWGPASLKQGFVSDDVLALPPLPKSARATARALAEAGHAAAAAHLLVSVAATIIDGQAEVAHALRTAAVPYLRQAGQWRAAWRLAWALGRPWRIFV